MKNFWSWYVILWPEEHEVILNEKEKLYGSSARITGVLECRSLKECSCLHRAGHRLKVRHMAYISRLDRPVNEPETGYGRVKYDEGDLAHCELVFLFWAVGQFVAS